MDSNNPSPAAPSLSPSALYGLKVIELGQLIAGPFADSAHTRSTVPRCDDLPQAR